MRSDELGQSYERTPLFAQKFRPPQFGRRLRAPQFDGRLRTPIFGGSLRVSEFDGKPLTPLSEKMRVLRYSEPPRQISPEYFQSPVESVGGKAGQIKLDMTDSVRSFKKYKQNNNVHQEIVNPTPKKKPKNKIDNEHNLDSLLTLSQVLSLPLESSLKKGDSLTPSIKEFSSRRHTDEVQRPLTPDEEQRIVTANTIAPNSIIIERSSNGYAVLRSGSNQAVEALTINSFYDDVLPQFMRSIPESDQPIQIYLNGFTPDEAKALILTGDLRQKAQQVVFRKDLPFAENVALLNRTYNWNSAIFKEIKVEPFPIGSVSGYRQIIDIEVESTIPNRPSLRMRIITFIKGLPTEIADRITAIIQLVLARSTPQPRNVNQVIFDIGRKLRKEFPDIDLAVEAGDMYIAEAARRDRLARR